MVVPKRLSLAEDREVQRTRKILIIILRVCLGLYVAVLVGTVLTSKLTTKVKVTGLMTQAGEAIIAILFYGFGIFVARRYSVTGIRVFAWLNITQLVLIGIGIVLLLSCMIVGLPFVYYGASGNDLINVLADGVKLSIFIFIIIKCIADFVLSVMIVKLAFKLARVIDANQR